MTTRANLGPSPTAKGLFIDGKWCDTDSEWVEATSPATGQIISRVPMGGRPDAARAIAAANAAFPSWSSRSHASRAQEIRRLAYCCQERRDELAHALTLDQGKPLHSEAYDEVDALIGNLSAAAENAIRLQAAWMPATRGEHTRSVVFRRPLGAVAIISPWNVPYLNAAHMGAHLGAGNTVVWTPSPTTTACSSVLADCIAEADLPSGVVNFVPGRGPEVGDELARNPGIRGIEFTGSPETGAKVAAAAAGKAMVLELGGNGPMVVLEDADLDDAAEVAVHGCFHLSGQSCTASERILVQREILDEFREALLAAVAREVRLGDPLDELTTLGPLHLESVARKTQAHVDDARARGATVLSGGVAADGHPTPLYWPATVIDNVPRDADIANEETFGPVAPLIEIEDLEDAIELTNRGRYGLLATICTRDSRSVMRFADSVRMGCVVANITPNYWENHLPFGGRSGTVSGVGRIGGMHLLESFTELQTVLLSE